ncbi:MAG: type I secretion protein [Oricola sp.]
MSLDPITETIAHFIGSFHLAVEEARGRDFYDRFRAEKAKQENDPEIVVVGTASVAPYSLIDVDPDLRYIPFSQSVEPLVARSWAKGDYQPVDSADTGAFHPHMPGHFDNFRFGLSQDYEYILTPPGSVAVVAVQHNHIYDNDLVNMPGVDVDLTPTAAFDAGLHALSAEAGALDPIGKLDMPASESAIADLVEGIARIVDGLSGDGPAPEHVQVLASGDAFAGIHVNGVKAEEAPKLSEHMPQEDEAEAPASVAFMEGEGQIDAVGSVTHDAGSNLLFNEVFMANNWVVSPVFAVMGDAVNVNMISQVNVWCDIDSIGAGFASWVDPAAAQTQAFNIASVTMDLTSDPDAEDAEAPTGFPQHWSVTRLDGNLVLLDWIQQLNFVTDHDATVLTHVGSQTMIQTGGNTSYNQFSLVELGAQYDLIFIGGGFYHANVIQQMNILLDNDFLWAANDFGVTGEGSVSASGNLLWNQATIHTIGDTRFEGISDDFIAAARGVAGGDDAAVSGLLGNSAFAGTGFLNVLYISGDFLNMQYVSQTNILGDSDQVAMYRETLDAQMDGGWEISTGSNNLVNIATIVDAGVDGTVYAGGEIYSDALLYQAELICDDPLPGIGDPSMLASEAVVFLADDMLDTGGRDDHADCSPAPTDTAHVDVMQTMLA